MSSPFDDDYNGQSPSRPQPALTNQSPRRFQNSYISDTHFNAFPAPSESSSAASKYSPNAFGRRAPIEDNYQSPYSSPTKLTLNDSPYLQKQDQPSSARKKFTELESPKRNKAAVVIIDDSDDEDFPYGSEVQRSPTRGSNSTSSSSRILPPPKPIFSASTYAAANKTELESDLEQGRAARISSTGSTIYSHDEEKFNEKLYPSTSNLSGDTYDYDIYTKENYSDEEETFEVPEHGQIRRHKSMIKKKEFVPENGNLILENPVPSKLASFLPKNDEDEFLFMRYSACTSEPDDFGKNGFTLRASKLNREIELCVCITMYNESEIDFTRSMHAVMKNVAHLCSRNKSKIWGKDGWKKVQVVIVSDGRAKINRNTLDVLAAMGVYQDDIAKSFVNSKPVKAHLFEYTTQVSLDPDLKFKSAEKGIVPVQVLFCLKEQNQKKINSHRWLFNAFCPVLDPNVVVLLDVGTKPNTTALYHLWKAFDRDSNIAGAAGEIKALKGKGWNKLLNPLVASQNFEYKMSNILDKPLESVFGYISVLPGALSAYRYKALLNHEDGTGPLNSYFKGEAINTGPNRDVFSANMYLAEDRVLCWELVAKKGSKWLLKYVKDAKGETDLPETVPEFISQRRRWLNGAFFAAIYSQLHFRQIWGTNHSFGRKVFLHVEFIYQFVQLLFSWFSIGNFYLTFYFLAGSLSSTTVFGRTGGNMLFTVFNYIEIATICAMFIISMGNRPQGAQHLFIISMALLSLCSTFAMVCGLYFAFKTLTSDSASHSAFINIVVSLLSTYGLYIFTSVLYLDPWHVLTCSMQYFLLLPSYTYTLQIFAFCNTHDVSWGTKGDNNPTKSLGTAIIKKDSSGHDIVEVDIPAEQTDIDSAYKTTLDNISIQRVKNKNPEKPQKVEIPGEDYYRDIRTRVVLFWLITNLILIMSMTQVYQPSQTASNKYLAFILWSVACLSLFRCIGSVSYLFMKYLRILIESKNKLEDGGVNFSIKNIFRKEE
ncbi:hypothetical protein WICMUC_002968 [Wickerhamomyces mucosus]|uniref:Chitin synthase n=1 Tax=Wickerhamomyces mucosus TaxID=1378264 RepID=A0A9P8PNU1_9ASCO|nr:hypothetical protein WICMUC_002968 [Wickerhamomyces mucosus]